MSRQISTAVCAIFILAIVASPHLFAQESIGDGILALTRTVTSQQREIGGRLYAGTIDGTISNLDGNPENFSDIDYMTHFSLVSTRDGGVPLVFPGGNKTEFNKWVDANASALLAILFPGSLSAGVTGLDAARNFSQELFLATMLGETTARESQSQRKSSSGGLLEREWFQRKGHTRTDSGSAWQGLYQMDRIHLSLLGRYAWQHEDVDTRSVMVGADFHPSLEINRDIHLRVGIDARTGVLYSRSTVMDLGSIDYGLGTWTSMQKDFSRLRLGAGVIFQGSNSYIPSNFIGVGLKPISATLNDRGIQYDLTYGAIAGFLTSDRTSLNFKLLETRAVAQNRGRGTSHVALASFSYLLGGRTPMDIGYKFSTGDGFRAGAVFVQGNFRW